MLKKFFILVFLFVSGLWILVTTTKAQNSQQFSTDYQVTYDVGDDGVTNVTEVVALKNLTDQYYASSFQLTIGATKLTDISAFDTAALDTTSVVEGTKTKITVKFNAQVAGKDKIQKFTLKFKSSDFAQQQGKVWQVSVPKISSVDGVNSYNFILSVPVSFGDPTSILPEPAAKSEQDGKIDLQFNKSQLTDSGILATFGENQLFSFQLHYTLNNSSILPSELKVPLPPDTDYQQVQVNNISPKPDNVLIDKDGNYLAYFKLQPRSTIEVNVDGLSKLYINSRNNLPQILSNQTKKDLTSGQKYWEKDNPLITAKLADIFRDGVPKTNREKAQLINNYVVNTLSYDTARLSKGDFSRLGGLTALNNPNQALCEEFTDLFISLARATGVPARELDGYAYTSNTDLRPLSFGSTLLHSWPEYYDENLGWIMIDPTWQNTTGGVNYFSKFDLNHLVLDIRGYSSDDPSPASDVKVDFSNAQFNPQPALAFSINSPDTIFAGFPSKFKVDVENNGSSLLPSSLLSLSAGRIIIAGNNTFHTPDIPPFGHASYAFDLRTPGLFQGFNDVISISVNGQTVTRNITVKPFFSYQYFPEIVLTLVLIMVVIYLTVLGAHIYRVKKSKS